MLYLLSWNLLATLNNRWLNISFKYAVFCWEIMFILMFSLIFQKYLVFQKCQKKIFSHEYELLFDQHCYSYQNMESNKNKITRTKTSIHLHQEGNFWKKRERENENVVWKLWYSVRVSSTRKNILEITVFC